MTINSVVDAALSAVLANTWADELPENPTFPAIVFEIDTQPEESWVLGGGYNQHTVTIFILARSKAAITAAGGLLQLVDAAMAQITGYMYDDGNGVAAYEDDASVYAHYTNYVIRLPV